MRDIDLHSANILIADDNEDDSVLLKRLLERAGYQNVSVIEDSRLVAAAHAEKRFDLILLDHNMPHLNGLAVLEQLKKVEMISYIPVLMVTAHSDRETRLRVLTAGCKDVISKPYDRTEIITRVNNMVEVRLLHNQVRDQNCVLQERENDLRAIVENIAEGVIATDETGVIKTFNEAAERIFGYKNEEVIGQNIAQFLSAEVTMAQTQEHRKGVECEGRRKNGDTFPLHIIVTQAMQNGQRAFVAICRDITEEKRAAEMMRASKDMLEERVKARTEKLIRANEKLVNEIKVREQTEKELSTARDNAIQASRLKSEFLANVSHEIRTPLNGMLGMLSLLSTTDLSGEQADSIKTAHKSGEILLELINELLDFSKAEAGKLNIEDVNYSPAELISELLQMFEEQINRKNLSLITNICDEMPQKVFGDPWRLRQVMINLIGNALKFTEEGEIRINMMIEREGDVHYILRFEVCDTGIGISPLDQERIFESFTQADGSTTRRFSGTGLGLSISRKLIDLMGGDIGVKSTVGQGSCFWIAVPQGKVERHVVPQRKLKEGVNHAISFGVEEESLSTNSLRILVVEDNEVNQKVALKMLKKLDCQVDVAFDGKEAVDAFTIKHYDLIMMDCLMPVMDGFEATRAIRQHEEGKAEGEHVPIVAMTANVRKQDQDKCFAAGMDDFLPKPLSIESIQRVIARWAEKTPTTT